MQGLPVHTVGRAVDARKLHVAGPIIAPTNGPTPVDTFPLIQTCSAVARSELAGGGGSVLFTRREFGNMSQTTQRLQLTLIAVAWCLQACDMNEQFRVDSDPKHRSRRRWLWMRRAGLLRTPDTTSRLWSRCAIRETAPIQKSTSREILSSRTWGTSSGVSRESPRPCINWTSGLSRKTGIYLVRLASLSRKPPRRRATRAA